jgi:hypothetical protein
MQAQAPTLFLRARIKYRLVSRNDTTKEPKQMEPKDVVQARSKLAEVAGGAPGEKYHVPAWKWVQKRSKQQKI